MVWRTAVLVLAVVGAVAPLPSAHVERLYTTGVYPPLQRTLTGLSNLFPFALFDVVCAAVALWWVAAAVRDIGWSPAGRRLRQAATRIVLRTLVMAALLYLAFLGSWGLNYRRVPLAEKLGLETGAIGEGQARELALAAVAELNALYEPSREAFAGQTVSRSAGAAVSAAGVGAGAEDAGVADTPGVASKSRAAFGASIDPALVDAFARAQDLVGAGSSARPARPKRRLLDPYFRATAVQGMTAPFFLETLLPSDLLPFEVPSVLAHEWSHLAGFADESEAGFVAWLACLGAGPGARYSGWLALYLEAMNALSGDARTEVAERLDEGPREDLRAMTERWQRNVHPALSSAGWQMYDRYLRANRVEAGVQSYGLVVRLVLGTELGRQAWKGT